MCINMSLIIPFVDCEKLQSEISCISFVRGVPAAMQGKKREYVSACEYMISSAHLCLAPKCLFFSAVTIN